MRRRAATLLVCTLACADGGDDLDPTDARQGFTLRFGGAAEDEPLALATSGDAAILVLGRFESRLDLGAGPIEPVSPRDLFLAQYDAEGGHVWSRPVDQTGASVELVRAQAAPGGWWLGGSFFGRRFDLGAGPIEAPLRNVAFAARLGADGETLWQASLQSSADSFVTDLAPAADGGLWVAGRFFGELSFAGTSTAARDADVFLAKLGPDGAPLALHRYGGPGLDTVTALAPRDGGGVWLAGLFEGVTHLDGQRLESRGGRDVYLAGIGPDGRIEALTRFGTADDELLSQLAVAPNGDLVLAGGLSAALDLGGGPLEGPFARDVFVARLGPDLSPRFSRRLSGPDFDTVRGVAVTEDDRIFLAGTFRGSLDVGGLTLSSAGDSDGFVVELSGSGQTLGALAFGTADREEVVADVRPLGRAAVLLGGIEGGADLGSGPVSSAGAFDLLVAKIPTLR